MRLEKSIARRPDLEPGCQERCPGCTHRHYSFEESIGQKQAWLNVCLGPWADVIDPIKTAPESERWGYREKACLHTQKIEGRWEFGLIRRDELIPIPDCPVHASRINRAVQGLTTALAVHDLPMVFCLASGSLMTLVLKCAPTPIRLGAEVYGELSRAGFKGLFLNFNPSAGNRVVASRGWRHLWGDTHGVFQLKKFGLSLRYGPGGFQQLMGGLYENSLQEALLFLDPKPGNQVIDLYSGIGTSLCIWKRAGAEILGVELGGEAVVCANENAGGEHTLRGRTSERLPQISAWLKEAPLAYVNPPRTGLEPEVLRWFSELDQNKMPLRLVYLSCNATSQARDLEVLTETGYIVKRIIPYDFFPNTKHVETLACLELDPLRRVRGSSGSRFSDRADR